MYADDSCRLSVYSTGLFSCVDIVNVSYVVVMWIRWQFIHSVVPVSDCMSHINWLMCQRHFNMDIERHVAHIIVSLPNPKQFLMVHFPFDGNHMKLNYSHNHQNGHGSAEYARPLILPKIYLRVDLTLDANSTEYSWRVFYISSALR